MEISPCILSEKLKCPLVIHPSSFFFVKKSTNGNPSTVYFKAKDIAPSH